MTMKDLPVHPVYTIEGDSVETTVGQIGEPYTTTVDVPVSDTETSVSFPTGTRRFLIKLDKGSMAYGYVSGGLNFRIGKGSALEITGIDPTKNITLYFKSSSHTDTLRVDYWK